MAKSPKPPSEELDKFLLRLPGDLRARVARAAVKNGRSMNAEIVQILEEHFPAAPSFDEVVADVKAMMSEKPFGSRQQYWRMLYAQLEQMKEEIDLAKRLDEDE